MLAPLQRPAHPVRVGPPPDGARPQGCLHRSDRAGEAVGVRPGPAEEGDPEPGHRAAGPPDPGPLGRDAAAPGGRDRPAWSAHCDFDEQVTTRPTTAASARTWSSTSPARRTWSWTPRCPSTPSSGRSRPRTRRPRRTAPGRPRPPAADPRRPAGQARVLAQFDSSPDFVVAFIPATRSRRRPASTTGGSSSTPCPSRY